MTVWYNPTQDFVDNTLSYAWLFDQIFIVDNTEDDNSHLAAQIPNAIYIPNGKNLGIAKALNQGIEAALIENTKGRDYRWVMTMDQDSAWDKEQLTQYIALCIEKSGEDAAIKSFSPSVVSPEVRYRHSTLGVWKRKIHKIITKKNCKEKPRALPQSGFRDAVICSGNIIDIAAWEDVGKFEEILFIDYVDIEFCYRLCENGYKIFSFCQVSMQHNTDEHGPAKQPLFPDYIGHKMYKNGDPVRFFYVMRNYMYFRKCHPTGKTKTREKVFLERVLAHCVFNRKALRNIKVLIRAYKDYKETLLPLIENERKKE